MAMVNCMECQNCMKEVESHEMPQVSYFVCLVLPQRSNLRSFPFKSAKCKAFAQKRTK